MSLPTTTFTRSPVERLFEALSQRIGHWMQISDLMVAAGFYVERRDSSRISSMVDRVTPFTSFYYHLEQLPRHLRGDGYSLHIQGQHVMLRNDKP